MTPVILASAVASPGPDTLAEVRIIYAAGGALRLPPVSFPQALQDAHRWAEAMHREGKKGAVIITC